MLRLPVELVDYVVELSNSYYVANALQGIISDSIMKRFERTLLIYGKVQSGKTRAIMKTLQATPGLRVLVIQNSLLVLKQYMQRLQDAGINAQVIGTDTTSITSELVVVLANCHRYAHFKRLVDHDNYTLILDEADLTSRRCPLRGTKTYFVTATPERLHYDNRMWVKTDPQYYGLDRIDTKVVRDEYAAVDKFLCGAPGMMLVNNRYKVTEMQEFAKEVSLKHPGVPIVMLSSIRSIYSGGVPKPVHHLNKTISLIIDSLKNYPHVIFVAHRLSSRGLSYTSSDYSRHLTCQYTKARNCTSFYQSLRLLGIYRDEPTLQVYVGSEIERERIAKWRDEMLEFDDIDVNKVYC
jgi:hypothetical protein